MIRHLLFLVIGVMSASVQAASPPDRFDVTFVSVLPDGGVKREIRPLRADEIRAMGVLDGVTIEASSGGSADGAPARPNAPLNGSVPDDLLRVDYHRAVEGWTRDTTYDRSRGGEWRLRSDALSRVAGVPGAGDRPPGPGGNGAN